MRKGAEEELGEEIFRLEIEIGQVKSIGPKLAAKENAGSFGGIGLPDEMGRMIGGAGERVNTNGGVEIARERQEEFGIDAESELLIEGAIGK